MSLEQFEELTRSNVVARRNELMGLWTGKQLGLTGDDLEKYALALHHADFEECGPRDVVRKVVQDLTGAGIDAEAEFVTRLLSKAEAEARRELLSTD